MVSYYEPRTEQMGFHLSGSSDGRSETYLGEMDKGLSTRTLNTLTNISLTSPWGGTKEKRWRKRRKKSTRATRAYDG